MTTVDCRGKRVEGAGPDGEGVPCPTPTGGVLWEDYVSRMNEKKEAEWGIGTGRNITHTIVSPFLASSSRMYRSSIRLAASAAAYASFDGERRFPAPPRPVVVTLWLVIPHSTCPSRRKEKGGGMYLVMSLRDLTCSRRAAARTWGSRASVSRSTTSNKLRNNGESWTHSRSGACLT